MEVMKAPTDITKTKDVKDIWDRKIEPFIYSMGFDYGVCCYANSEYNSMEIITTKNAILWIKHHIAGGYPKYDPIAKAVFKKKRLIWNQVDESDKNSIKISDERRSYGMKCGITVPVLNKVGDLISWFSLATKNSQEYFNSIISDSLFKEKIYDIHIKTVSHALSKTTGIDFNLCYAIVLSHYTNKINFISQKTGFLVDDLHKLYSYLYLYHHNIDFFCLDIQQTIVSCVKDVHYFLKESDALRYKFTDRQRDCIELIKKGLTAKQAARMLKMSPRTFEWHTSQLKQKLECNNQRELIFKLSNRQLVIR